MRNRFTLTQEEAIKSSTWNLIDFCKNSYKDLIIIRGTNKKEKATLTVFKGKSAKAVANYFYPTYERREEAIASWKQIADTREKEIAERKAAKKAAGAPKSEIGDIFVNSWGYDQTNVDYYQIVSRPSAHYAIFRKIKSSQVDESQGMDCCNVMPVKDEFCGEEFRAKLTICGKSEYFRVNSYSSASKWDGTSNYCSWYA